MGMGTVRFPRLQNHSHAIWRFRVPYDRIPIRRNKNRPAAWLPWQFPNKIDCPAAFFNALQEKTSGSAHLRKLERQLEPKPEENEGHFSRARSSNESVFPVRIEFY